MNQSREKTSRLLKLAVPAFAVALLAGCASGDEGYFPKRTGYIDTPERSTVEVTESGHTIAMSNASANLTSVQIDDLNQFLAQNGRHYGDHIEIRGPLVAGIGQGPTAASRAADELRSAFIKAGYLSTRVHLINDPTVTEGLRVTLQRYEVVLPDCTKEWDEDKGGFINEPVGIRSLGCSNERNLGLMIADPRDLAGYRETGPSSGPREIEAIIRYNTDKVKDPTPANVGQKITKN